MHYLVEKTFEKRGFTEELLSKINDRGHSLIDQIVPFTERLHEIYLQHKHIIFLPDFDMDGIASGTIGYAGLCELGFYASLYLPDTTSGYGFDASDIIKIVSKWPDTSVIITGDVGISCTDGISYARSIGIEVLVTDHHKDTIYNGANLAVDPSSYESTYSNALGHSSICGAYVIWQVLSYYAHTYCNAETISNIDRLLVFAGIGTVSDTMPMLCENRSAVLDAIGILKWLMPSASDIEAYPSFEDYVSRPLSGYHNLGVSQQYRDVFYGLQALMWYFRSKKRLHRKDINEEFFGFTLAPMFNSLKRLGGDIGVAFGVFFDRTNALSHIEELDDLNEQRKELVAFYMAEISSTDQPFAPFIYFSSAPGGILGLLATKLLHMSGTPTIVVNNSDKNADTFSGSGRSPEGYDFMEALARIGISHSELSVKGHPHSFGAFISSDFGTISFVYTRLMADFSMMTSGIDIDPFEIADFVIGSNSETSDVGFDPFELYEYFVEINTYRPFGHGFFKPQIAIHVSEADMSSIAWSIIGAKSQHAKYAHINGLDVIMWNGAGDTYFCRKGFSAIGHLQYVEFNGFSSLAFVVDDLFDYNVKE